jgi:hypothetical protein
MDILQFIRIAKYLIKLIEINFKNAARELGYVVI